MMEREDQGGIGQSIHSMQVRPSSERSNSNLVVLPEDPADIVYQLEFDRQNYDSNQRIQAITVPRRNNP